MEPGHSGRNHYGELKRLSSAPTEELSAATEAIPASPLSPEKQTPANPIDEWEAKLAAHESQIADRVALGKITRLEAGYERRQFDNQFQVEQGLRDLRKKHEADHRYPGVQPSTEDERTETRAINRDHEDSESKQRRENERNPTFSRSKDTQQWSDPNIVMSDAKQARLDKFAERSGGREPDLAQDTSEPSRPTGRGSVTV